MSQGVRIVARDNARHQLHSGKCIAKLNDIFTRFGIPSELVCDNAPQFKSFAELFGITHVTSSPYLPNANGEAERTVQTAKRILKWGDPWLVLIVYIRTTLPTLPTTLRSRWPNPDLVRRSDF